MSPAEGAVPVLSATAVESHIPAENAGANTQIIFVAWNWTGRAAFKKKVVWASEGGLPHTEPINISKRGFQGAIQEGQVR